MYINGEWIKTDDTFDVINPATGEVVGTVYNGGFKETEQAIEAAKNAFPTWSSLTAEQRAAYLHRVVELLTERQEQLAQTITKEMGKTIHHARYEVGSAIAFFKWYAEEARRVYGDTLPASAANKRIVVIRQPVGVVAAITPWNFPLSMGARKLGPALAVGCTVILKPAEDAPLSSVELFKIFHDVGMPRGVVNLVTGDPEPIGKTLLESKDVRKISFTGSTEVGKLLIRESAANVKRVSMELGGHAPFIVFDDADVELAVEGLIRSKFASSGQQCVCANRVYVQEGIYDVFVARLIERVKQMKVGNGLDESVDMGPLVNESAVDKVDSHVKDAVAKGACVLIGGKRLTEGDYNKGYFYAPTVLGDVTTDMLITKEETFGPVAPLIRFKTEEEVLAQANDIEYGLASYVYTNDVSRIIRVSERLEYGMVGVNDPAPFSVQIPFGGVKESGLGREGGKYGLEDYLEYKTISIQFKDKSE